MNEFPLKQQLVQLFHGRRHILKTGSDRNHSEPVSLKVSDKLRGVPTVNTYLLDVVHRVQFIYRFPNEIVIDHIALGDMAVQYVIEELTNLSVRVELASEFRYRKMKMRSNSLVIVISQSGETADSLAALRSAKEQGIRTLGIVNVVGSSIAREADHVFYTLAGPEISVATTKAYSTQLIAGYLLAIQFAKAREEISDDEYHALIAEISTIPDKIEKILADQERIQWFSAKLVGIRDAFFIGRGIDYAISLEGSLKMKEISYIHSEAYAAGELKHGPISLIEDGTVVISTVTQPELYEKTVSNMVEVKSRGANLLGITTYGNYAMEDAADFTVYIPKIDPLFAGSLSVIPLQLLGYYVSVGRGFDVDKPRNLAKSVTVE